MTRLLLSAALLPLLGCPAHDAPLQATAQALPITRESPPGPLAVHPFTLAEPQRLALSNGLPVLLLEDHEIPLVELQFALNVGTFTDPPGQEGLADSALDMMNEGAGEWSAIQIADHLRRLGADMFSSAYVDGGAITTSCLRRNLEPTLDLWSTVLLHPTFPESEWRRIRNNRIAREKSRREDPTDLALDILDRVAFQHQYAGRRPSQQSYERIAVDDLQAWYDVYFTPANALVLVSGDVSAQEILPLLESRLGDWSAAPATPTPEPQVNQPEQTHVYLVDVPDASQSVMAVSRFGPSRLDDDYFAFYVGNQALGGQFTSRLNLNLREDKGYTYGIYSRNSHSHAGNQWYAATAVQREVTWAALQEILAEIRGVAGERPLQTAELEYVRNGLIHGYPARFEDPQYRLRLELGIWRYGLPADWLDHTLNAFAEVTLEQVNAALARHLRADALTVVVVGDLSTIADDFYCGDLPVTELDHDGQPLAEQTTGTCR